MANIHVAAAAAAPAFPGPASWGAWIGTEAAPAVSRHGMVTGTAADLDLAAVEAVVEATLAAIDLGVAQRGDRLFLASPVQGAVSALVGPGSTRYDIRFSAMRAASAVKRNGMTLDFAPPGSPARIALAVASRLANRAAPPAPLADLAPAMAKARASNALELGATALADGLIYMRQAAEAVRIAALHQRGAGLQHWAASCGKVGLCSRWDRSRAEAEHAAPSFAASDLAHAIMSRRDAASSMKRAINEGVFDAPGALDAPRSYLMQVAAANGVALARGMAPPPGTGLSPRP